LRRAEGLEREQTDVSGAQQEVERLRQERQQLAEDAERENAGLRSYAAQQEQEVARLEQELQGSQEALDGGKRADSRRKELGSPTGGSWWRRPVLMVGLLAGGLIVWLISLAVALTVLAQ
jgi:hypothetical protein